MTTLLPSEFHKYILRQEEWGKYSDVKINCENFVSGVTGCLAMWGDGANMYPKYVTCRGFWDR